MRRGIRSGIAGRWTSVAVAGYNGSNQVIQVTLGSSHGVLGSPTTIVSGVAGGISALAAGDVNNDGKPDLVVLGCNGEIGVLLGLGNGKFKTPVYYSTSSTAQSASLVLADLRNNGKLDIVVSNSDGSLSVLLNKGKGVYATATIIPGAASGTENLATGDFNGDGKLDLVISDWGDNSLNVLLGNGDGTFQSPVHYEVDQHPGFVAVGDFNKDGKLDLVTGGYSVGNDFFGQGGIAILLGNGDGTFAPNAATLIHRGPRSPTSTRMATPISWFHLGLPTWVTSAVSDPTTLAWASSWATAMALSNLKTTWERLELWADRSSLVPSPSKFWPETSITMARWMRWC